MTPAERNAVLEEAARVIDRRADTEARNSDHHKACGRDYKAREAAHVARIARQDAAAIRALKEREPKE
jgi:hypothetical protein